MDSDGFVSLWRKSIDSRVFKNSDLWKVWTWCLMRANYTERWVEIKSGKSKIEVHVKPGEFVFGRKSAAKELGMPESSVRNRMKKLKKMRNVDIKEARQYSIVSIVNWNSYQRQDEKEDSKEDRQRTGKGQAKDTDNKDNKGNKKRKQEKKVQKSSKGEEKTAYREYVKLTPKEYARLRKKFGESKLNWCLGELNNYIGANPGKRVKMYTSHSHVLQGWVSEKYEKNYRAGAGAQNNIYPDLN